MLLETRELSMSTQGHKLFNGVTMQCEPGSIVALTGPSGAGKTTLLGCLGLLVRPTSGTILFDGVPVSFKDRNRARFWRDYAAFIYQDYGVIEDESVAYNVALRGSKRSLARDERVAEVLKQVGLGGRASQSAAVLSGGEKQRLGIARALYKNAQYIFADEPTASLDADNRSMVMNLLRDAAHQGASVILATHDEELVKQSDLVLDVSAFSA